MLREFKLSNGYFWREFALISLASGVIAFGLSITKYNSDSTLLPTIGGALFASLVFVIQNGLWPPLKAVAIEPAAHKLTYKLLWRHPVQVNLSQIIVDTRAWETRGGTKTGLSFFIGFQLLFRAAKGPWKENDLAEIHRLVTSQTEL